MQIDFKPPRDVHTRIIWSFAHDVVDEQLAATVATAHCDALRLVYFQGMKTRSMQFLQALSLKQGERRVPIMVDVALKIRATVSELKQPRQLKIGEKVNIVPRSRGKRGDLVIKTDEWQDLFVPDATIYMGTGDVMLKCLTVQKDVVTAEVTQGEAVYPHAPIKIPRTNKDLTARDLMLTDIEQFLDQNIDFIVIPGITVQEEVQKFRAFLQQKSTTPPWMILKIDTLKVYQELPRLITEVDGVLISRREIALTTNPATVPMIAKEVNQLCNDHSKLVITASEVLGSMRYNPAPTRAEVSDIANAVIDGTDVIVLPEDLCTSRYFVRSLRLVYDVVADVESSTVAPNWDKQAPTVRSEYDALAASALRTAQRVQAKALVCIVHSGKTALRLSRFGTHVPIIAVAFERAILNRLRLIRGVCGILLDTTPSLDEVLTIVGEQLKKSSFLKNGDLVIFVTISLSPIGRAASNLLTVQTLR